MIDVDPIIAIFGRKRGKRDADILGGNEPDAFLVIEVVPRAIRDCAR